MSDKRTTPEVSVVMPTFNRAHFLGRAIESVLSQTFADYEIVVIDDGSTDETRFVVEKFADPRIRYVWQKNSGLASARGSGIANSRGVYVAFLDDDDLFLPHKLASQVEFLNAHPDVDFVAGGHLIADAAGKPLREAKPWLTSPRLDLQTWLLACPVVPVSVLVRRLWLERVGRTDTSLRRSDDWDLWLRLAHAGCRMAWLEDVVCVYTVHDSNMVRHGALKREANVAILDKFFAQPDLPSQLCQARQRAYATVYLSSAFWGYGANQVDFARQSLGEAIEGIPALMRGDIPPLTYFLITWAVEPITGEPATFVGRVLDNLPDSASRLCFFRQRLLCAAAIRAAVDANLVHNSALARQYLVNALEVENSLCDNPTLVVEQLVDYVRSQEFDCQVECIKNFFDNLPSELTDLLSCRRRALGRLYMARAFESYEKRESTRTRAAIIRGVYYDPSWLRNRGVWSIMLRSLLGYSGQGQSRASGT